MLFVHSPFFGLETSHEVSELPFPPFCYGENEAKRRWIWSGSILLEGNGRSSNSHISLDDTTFLKWV
jgi:hypothetical protein